MVPRFRRVIPAAPLKRGIGGYHAGVAAGRFRRVIPAAPLKPIIITYNCNHR